MYCRFRIFLYLSGFCKKIEIPPWSGELGYELLYWIPFLKRSLLNKYFDEIIVTTRSPLKEIYLTELGEYAETITFTGTPYFKKPSKQISLNSNGFFRNGRLIFEPCYMYLFLRLCRAGYVRPSKIDKWFLLGHKNRNTLGKKTCSGVSLIATLWIYENDSIKKLSNKQLQFIIDALFQKGVKIMKVLCSSDHTEHVDYNFSDIILPLNVELHRLTYEKKVDGSGLNTVINCIENSDYLVCSEGGGSYFSYYFGTRLVTVKNFSNPEFFMHHYFEQKHQQSNKIERDSLDLTTL